MELMQILSNNGLNFHTIKTIVLKVLGIFSILFAFVLIFGVIFTYFKYYFPYLMTMKFPLLLAHLACSLWLSFGVLYSYYKVLRTKPGSVPLGLKTTEQMNRIKQGLSHKYRYCKKCDYIKPPRSHHDSVTGKCVLKMDHYCVWINDCVGHYNHKFFLLFLMYLSLGCLYVVLCTLPAFLVDIGWLKSTSIPEYSNFTFAFIICGSVLICISFLLFWHTYLALTNQTTIDFYENREAEKESKKKGKIDAL
ncbi:palmitoyltransferase zdhhc16 [Anaeramoeba flamelloides]|uniref:Palmitoyltransferase n=1 Tax=Anaeramoeba flamelloides TaxID=1746091 RepID=A0ABQ8XM99_9EUKA|nr:palmitoyltransferase zdhhc16 [Anaeramoeba flamelloides]